MLQTTIETPAPDLFAEEGGIGVCVRKRVRPSRTAAAIVRTTFWTASKSRGSRHVGDVRVELERAPEFGDRRAEQSILHEAAPQRETALLHHAGEASARSSAPRFMCSR